METTKLENFDPVIFNDLVEKFEKCHKLTKNLAVRLKQWKPGGTFDPKDKSDLEKYYIIAADDNRRECRIIARKIRDLVFGPKSRI